MPSPRRHPFNLQRDVYDSRDLRAAPPVDLASIPLEVDLTAKPGLVPEIWNQGQLGSCTGHGGGRVFEIARRAAGFAAAMPSRLFIYFCERDVEGTIDQDAGAQIRDCIKVMAKYGVPEERFWPYLENNWKLKPSAPAYSSALTRQVVKYTRLNPTPQAVCAAIAAGKAVVFGFSVYASFESDAVAKTGVVPMPAKGERTEGGHCVAATGYKITSKGGARSGFFGAIADTLLGARGFDGYLICDNSWGPDWGAKGRFYLPFAFITKQLAWDFWTVDAVEG
jgi:C1A family cysteine protease